MREVTLDNQPLDISDAQAPAIIFNNPIFTDISTMKANRTSTYTLPLSEHNKKIIGLLNELDIDNDYMRRLHVLDEFRDGFNIIPKASTKILRVTPENIEMSCVWGSIKSVASELDSLSIQELAEETVPFGTIPYITDDTQKVGLLYLQTFPDNLPESRPENDARYHFPSMRCDRLLEKIQEKCSVPIILSPEVAAEWVKYWVPCLTNNLTTEIEYSDDAVAQTIVSGGIYPGVDVPYKRRVESGIVGSIWIESPINLPRWAIQKNNLDIIGTYSGSYIIQTGAWNPHFRLTFDLIVPGAFQGRIFTVRVLWQSGYNSTPDTRVYNWKVGANSRVQFTLDDDIDITGDQFNSDHAYIQLQLFWDGVNGQRLNVNDGGLTSASGILEWRFWNRGNGTVDIGEPFPVMHNLPNISCIDFIKNMMWLTGSYPTTTLNGAVEIRSLSSILPNITTAVPLDSKLMYRQPRERSFTYGNYARRNWMKWAEDTSVKTNADGYFDIADETLEKENDVFKLAFAPSDSGSIAALLPIFEYSEKEPGVWETTKVTNLKPRLVKRSELFRENYSYYTGEFTDDMNFQTLIPITYDMYLRLLTNTNACKVMFSMTPSEISQFNEDTIFYFNGMHWMQIQTSVDGNGIATAEMLQVTVHQKPTR